MRHEILDENRYPYSLRHEFLDENRYPYSVRHEVLGVECGFAAVHCFQSCYVAVGNVFVALLGLQRLDVMKLDVSLVFCFPTGQQFFIEP